MTSPQYASPIASASVSTARHEVVRRSSVLDSFISHRELDAVPGVGTKTKPAATLVFLHGNPLSSRVWRAVLPLVAPQYRCLAPDLIGMGDSGKPNLAYRFADHARYLEAWLDALDLHDVVFVGYDWGGVLALDFAARHPDRVRGLAAFETFWRPMEWSEWSPRGAELFRALRSPGAGEGMILGDNEFLARSLANGIHRPLSDVDKAAYYAPYEEPASRRPILQWTREIPIGGEPADVAARMAGYGAWLASSSAVPKLLLSFEAPAGTQPSPTGSPAMVEWVRAHVAGLEAEALGPAAHHAPEDAPAPIADALNAWLARHEL